MIKYALRCSDGHQFEGWFPDSARFEQQADAGLLSCPFCGTSEVERAPMAPRILKGGKTRSAEPEGATAEATAADAKEADATATDSETADTSSGGSPPAPVPSTVPDKHAVAMAMVTAKLRALRAVVEANFDYVGNRFADEARRIHNGDVEHREIYGEATPEEAEALEDDGIPVAQVPWIRDDA